MHSYNCRKVFGAWLAAIPAIAAPTDIPPAASFYITHLPDLHQNEVHPLHMWSGHLPADPHASKAASNEIVSHLYFVLVKNRRLADKERVIFWFNGGPGCSSFDGLMMELGPWRVDFKGGIKTAEGGWEEYTTMVYVDQPAGTGFSYASTDKYVHTLEEASEQWIEFLRNFYKVFPEYQRMDTYLAGESFAGQYIPYFADALMSSNLPTPFRGIAIGNGWQDARRQYPSFIDYSVKHGLLEEHSEAWKTAKHETERCIEDLEKITGMEPITTHLCDSLLMKVVKSKERTIKDKRMCLNIYDVRFEDTYPACGLNWPPDIKHITTYLDRNDVVRALHAEAAPESWIECRGSIYSAFQKNRSNSSITLLPKILEKIPALIFAGDQDIICNYMGLEAMMQGMTWNGHTGFGTVQTQSWSVNGTPAGTWVSNRNLTYVKIFNASHMAPYDVPHVTHDMMLRFMGVNFSAITDGSAKIPSSVGPEFKPLFVEGNKPVPSGVPGAETSPQRDQAMWEAYYNAGSAALILVIVLLVIGTLFWCRMRRRKVRLSNSATMEEESIPLNTAMSAHDRGGNEEDDENFRQRKGKDRVETPMASEPPIFDVGEDEDEDVYKSDTRR